MGLRDIINSMKERSQERKDKLKQMDENMRIEEILTERRKSANERELEMFMKENREEGIKEQLQKMRKIRDDEIRFGHNPLNAKNIIVDTDFEVLKQKNLFKGKSNMFSNKHSILKNNNKLLKSNMRLMK